MAPCRVGVSFEPEALDRYSFRKMILVWMVHGAHGGPGSGISLPHDHERRGIVYGVPYRGLIVDVLSVTVSAF